MTRQRRSIRPRSAPVSLVAITSLALALSACGDSDADVSTEVDEPTETALDESEPDTEPDEGAEPEEQTADVDEPAAEPAVGDEPEGEAADGDTAGGPAREPAQILTLPAGPASFPIIGGIEFELPVDSSVIHASGCVIIESAGYEGTSPFSPAVIMAEVRFTGMRALEPLSGIDGWIASYEGGPEPQPTGETLNLLDREFTAYRVEMPAQEMPPLASFLNCTTEEDVVSDTAIHAGPFADVLVAESDGRLLMIDAQAFTEEEQLVARALRDEILPTLVLTES